MTETDGTQGSRAARDALDLLLQSNSITLGDQQRRRLQWLSRRCGAPMLWDKQSTLAGQTGLVIVLEPPSGPSAELFYRALHPGCVVVIPFGENPAFDFLKSKLVDFGTIGASGADGPHELWWGGLSWSRLSRNMETQPPRIVSCYPRDLGEGHAEQLEASLTALGLDFAIEPIDTVAPGKLLGFEKSNFILKMWQQDSRPLLWVDADAILIDQPSLPPGAACDFAVHKWNRWEMAGRTLYFGRSHAAETMLRTWHCLASSYATIWEGYVLDQAWSLVSSQMALDTVWLPRSYHATSADCEPRNRPVIVHALAATACDLGPDPGFPKALRAARRASRTGAPESLITVKSGATSLGAITVILRDIQATGARALAASVEAVTRAFVDDPGGFSHLELSLCPWQEDVKAAISAATFASNRILEIAPSQQLPGNMFRSFAETTDLPSRGNVIPLPARGRTGRATSRPIQLH
jgi:hypothetical protein